MLHVRVPVAAVSFIVSASSSLLTLSARKPLTVGGGVFQKPKRFFISLDFCVLTSVVQ